MCPRRTLPLVRSLQRSEVSSHRSLVVVVAVDSRTIFTYKYDRSTVYAVQSSRPFPGSYDVSVLGAAQSIWDFEL